MRPGPFARAVAVLALTALPGAGHALDLMQTWRTALGKDPTYASARAAYRAGLEKLPQARAGLLPSVAGLVGGEYDETRTTRGLGRQDSVTRGIWNLSLVQPIFDYSRWQNFEQSKLLVADTEVVLQTAYQDLMLRVAQAYFDVLAAQDTLAAIEAEKAAVAEQLAAARRTFELGNATITDTYEAQARYDVIVADELQAQNDLEITRDILARILGEPPDALAELPYNVRLPAPQPNRLEDWSTQSETASLDVVRARLRNRIAQYGIEIARGGHYPTLNLEATTGSASDGVLNGAGPGRPVDSVVGLNLRIPLYAGGGISSRVTESVELAQAARHDYEAARRQAIQQARQFFTGVNTGLARIGALEAGERSSRAAVEANRTGYEIGVRINLDVLNAQQQLYATLRDLAQARYNTVMAGLRLKATSGILSETDLESINQLLRAPGDGPALFELERRPGAAPSGMGTGARPGGSATPERSSNARIRTRSLPPIPPSF